MLNIAAFVNSVKAHFYVHWKVYSILGYGIYISLLSADPVLAASSKGLGGGQSLIMLMQKASFWIGLGVVIWGIIEAMLDYPGWKGRVTKGLLGYIGILVAPLVFLELRNNLQVDVWNQINSMQ